MNLICAAVGHDWIPAGGKHTFPHWYCGRCNSTTYTVCTCDYNKKVKECLYGPIKHTYPAGKCWPKPHCDIIKIQTFTSKNPDGTLEFFDIVSDEDMEKLKKIK